jgi:hypothetical protein
MILQQSAYVTTPISLCYYSTQPLFVGVCPTRSDTFYFFEKGVKTGAQVYQEDVLQGVVKHLKTTVFNGQKWVFQQNSAPAHMARRLRSGCGESSGLYQHRGLALGESRPQPPGL